MSNSIISKIVSNTGDAFPIFDQRDVKGGIHSVKNIDELNSFNKSFLSIGMKVYVESENRYYVLNNDNIFIPHLIDINDIRDYDATNTYGSEISGNGKAFSISDLMYKKSNEVNDLNAISSTGIYKTINNCNHAPDDGKFIVICISIDDTIGQSHQIAYGTNGGIYHRTITINDNYYGNWYTEGSGGSSTDTPVIQNIDIMKGPSEDADGKEGLVPKPLIGDNNKVLYGDGTWKDPVASIDINIDDIINSIPIMVGATEENRGKEGLVPQPIIGDNNKFLSGDGTYKDIDSDSILNQIIINKDNDIDLLLTDEILVKNNNIYKMVSLDKIINFIYNNLPEDEIVATDVILKQETLLLNTKADINQNINLNEYCTIIPTNANVDTKLNYTCNSPNVYINENGILSISEYTTGDIIDVYIGLASTINTHKFTILLYDYHTYLDFTKGSSDLTKFINIGYGENDAILRNIDGTNCLFVPQGLKIYPDHGPGGIEIPIADDMPDNIVIKLYGNLVSTTPIQNIVFALCTDDIENLNSSIGNRFMLQASAADDIKLIMQSDVNSNDKAMQIIHNDIFDTASVNNNILDNYIFTITLRSDKIMSVHMINNSTGNNITLTLPMTMQNPNLVNTMVNEMERPFKEYNSMAIGNRGDFLERSLPFVWSKITIEELR